LNTARTKLIWLALLPWLAGSACGKEPPKAGPGIRGKQVAPGVLLIGRIANPRLTESSGVVASRAHPGVFWSHTDGGGPRKQILFGLTREGRTVCEVPVIGVLLHDWEDIAIDDQQHLFIGDIGNNEGRRKQIAVYQIAEPDPKSPGSSARVTRGWQLRFPEEPFDCESLFVWQTNGYLVSKVLNDQRAELYRFPLTEQKEPFVLEQVARLKIDSPVTGAEISADGRLLGLVARSGAFVYHIDGNLNRIGRLKPWHTKFRHEHIESCCFVPEGMLVTAESREIYLFTEDAFKAGPPP